MNTSEMSQSAISTNAKVSLREFRLCCFEICHSTSLRLPSQTYHRISTSKNIGSSSSEFEFSRKFESRRRNNADERRKYSALVEIRIIEVPPKALSSRSLVDRSLEKQTADSQPDTLDSHDPLSYEKHRSRAEAHSQERKRLNRDTRRGEFYR